MAYMYRRTARAEKSRKAQAALRTRRANIAAGPAPDYPQALPTLRRTIIVIDRDFGQRVTRLDLYRTPRVDSYDVHVDGIPWRRMGWSAVLAVVRQAHVRVASERAVAG